MRLLEFDKTVSLSTVIDAVKSIPEKDITIRLAPNTLWMENPVNKKILRKAAQSMGKTVHFDGEEELAAEIHPPTETPAQQPPASPAPQPLPAPLEDPAPDDSGFVVGEDVAASQDSEPAPTTAAIRPQAEPEVAPPPSQPPNHPTPRSGSSGKAQRFGAFLRRHWVMSIVGAVALVLLLLAYTVFFLPKADVKIIVEQRSLESSATVTATSKVTSPDTKAHIIPAVAKTSNQSGTQSAQTTGSKLTGTKATGTVTLYNSTDFDKSLAVGSSLTAAASSGSLKFTVSQAATLPKRNQFTGVPTGVDISVSAADIGDKYNVPVNTPFSLDAAPADIKGINAAALTGGTSKTVHVVAQADIDKLLSELTKSLTDKAKQDVLQQAGKDYQIPDQGIKTTVSNKSFDHATSDQADSVNLNLTITATASVYKAADLKDMLISSLENNTPDGFQVDKSNVETSADLANVADNGDLSFAGHIKAYLTPKFDTDKLAGDLAGKNPSAADPIIKALPSVLSDSVTFWPNLPGPLKTFPRDPHRIHITVSVNK